MSTQVIRVVDVEATGLTLEPDHGLCEFGWVDVYRNGGEPWQIGNVRSLLLNPGRSITPETSAIHHLIDEDVADCPNWKAAVPGLLRGTESQPVIALCAHHAEFERIFLTDDMTGGLPWICTMKVAYRMWKEAPSFSNQGLRYWRKPEGLDRSMALPAHRAGPDAYVTAFHLRDMLNQPVVEVEHLIKVSNRPSLLPRVMFGKHYGLQWSEVDTGYLEWCCRQSDMDEDVKYTAQHHLIARKQQGRL